jgi:hypothetical protein
LDNVSQTDNIFTSDAEILVFALDQTQRNIGKTKPLYLATFLAPLPSYHINLYWYLANFKYIYIITLFASTDFDVSFILKKKNLRFNWGLRINS